MRMNKGTYDVEVDDSCVIVTLNPSDGNFIKFAITKDSAEKLGKHLLDLANEGDEDDADEYTTMPGKLKVGRNADWKNEKCKTMANFLENVSYKQFLVISDYVKERIDRFGFVRFADIYEFLNNGDFKDFKNIPAPSVLDWKLCFKNVASFRLFAQTGDTNYIVNL